jgi:hypothetical protein
LSPPKKIQCQLTRIYLGQGARRAGGIWECPHCRCGETYVQAEIVDPDLCELVEGAVARARQLFGVKEDGKETRILLGDSPETVFEEDLNAFHIYLDRSSNWLQYCYSGSHEAFHRACSPGTRGHWVDEMLAVHFSLLYLRELDLEDHAELNEVQLGRQSEICPRSAILDADGHGYPDGSYGAFFSLGCDLIKIVGWDGLVDLNRFRESRGQPEPGRWIANLSEDERRRIAATLGGPASILDPPQ